MGAFVQIVGSFKETLQKILIRSELDEYEDDKQMHCNARLAEMVDNLSQDLQSSVNFSEHFLVEEMQILEEANGIRLPHFLPHLVFSSLLKRIVNSVSDLPVCFVNNVCGYLEIVCVRALLDCCGSYPQLLPSMKKATQNVTGRMKIKFMERVDEMIEMEKMTDYTCDPQFIPSYDKLMGNIEADIVNEVMVNGGGIEKRLVEPPSVAKKRERLQSSIRLLKESKEIIEQVMDGIVVASD
ncbi:hypothetical protein E3N88_27474 [Mikania micrantha]|uniref:Dynamin stalk domain-containing protein n=1 Tax=Mikania micrantha TaxID=192012 RepID=A0A5N6MWR2_9ASTR|nr:hypothetical protein E3N88_27474 [Mikania micrantha]